MAGKAIPELQQAVRANPKDSEALGALGGAYSQKGDRANAVANLEKALALDPHSSNNDKWNSLLKVNRYWLAIQQGDAALKANNPDRAERLFQQARNVDNTDSYAVLGLGDVAMARKDYPAAERYYQQTLRMDSGNTNAVRGLANIYRQQSPEKAEAFIASLSASQRRSIDDIERSLQNDRLAQQAEALENPGQMGAGGSTSAATTGAGPRQRMDYLPTFAGSLAGRTTQRGRYVNAQSGAAEVERPGAGLRLRAVPLWS